MAYDSVVFAYSNCILYRCMSITWNSISDMIELPYLLSVEPMGRPVHIRLELDAFGAIRI